MIDLRDHLIKICIKNMQIKNCNDQSHKDRFKKELQEIDSQADHEYFLDLYNANKKFCKNENNLFVVYLLGLCEDFDINKDPTYIQGEFPDIDVDYLPAIQDYLRNNFCPKAFGRDKVVNIGNYGTFGMKSALLDMARVHGIDRNEIQSITKNLQDRDEEGNPLTWEKALEISPELSEYSKKYPEVTDSARRLIDRNRSRGKHAGGTVVSSVKIDDFVPIMIDTDGNPVSGWTEGLHDQDLQPVGLIKFDVLAIKDLLRIANCCKLIKKRHPEITSISALEGCSDWSDTSYLNDLKAIALANEAKTRGIFQFDSEGMRNLVKSGGVDCFDDLVAYTALFRPGPLGMGMHEKYIERKKGKEGWEDQVPDCIKEVLRKTHGILCFQEQVMKVLNIVGDIPLIHCEKIRKAISKKKIAEFSKYKQMFLENGSTKTGWPISSDDDKNMNFLWDQLESFSSYGFNASHACAYTYTSSRLLYLKAHYPLEFFVSTLSLESDEDKLKSYKREAERFGIKINRCDLNKSKSNFEIIDDEIYIGFSNIKGIGKEVSEEIVNNQPYSGVEDFLKRFGTDKRIVEPLIYLEVLKEKPINILLEFYEEYKKWSKSNLDKNKRQDKRKNDLMNDMKAFLIEEQEDILNHEYLIKLYENFDSFEESILSKEFSKDDFYQVLRKYWKSVSSYEQKCELIEQNFISLENWEPKNIYSIDKIPNQFDIEKKYYGFSWQHPLEKSPDYSGDLSFTRFKDDELIYSAGVECMVTKKPEEKISKNGNKYYYVLVEDEDWNVEVVTFWQEDYNRFKEELNYWNKEENRGHLLKIRVTRPGKGFRSYTFESPRKQERHKLPEDKQKDYRLQIMEPPKIREVKND
jgi:DNA polymerase III alpha subunit